MEAAAWIAKYREMSEIDRTEFLRGGLVAEPGLIDALLAWAAEAEGVETGDFWLLSEAADQVADEAAKGHLKVAEAELRWMEGDSTQYVLDVAFEAIGWNPDLARPYEMVYELLRNSYHLVWEEGFERLGGHSLPADAWALLRHIIDRGNAKEEGAPGFLSLAPRDGASAADVDALVGAGLVAEAIAARRTATGEDFATARGKVFSAKKE